MSARSGWAAPTAWTPRQRGLAAALAGTVALCAGLALSDDAGSADASDAAAALAVAPPRPVRAPGAEAFPGTTDNTLSEGAAAAADPAPIDWPAPPALSLRAWGLAPTPAARAPAAATPRAASAVAVRPPAAAPSPTTTVAPAPPPPAAPVPAYTWLGRLERGGQVLALLADAGHQGRAVAAGTALDAQWRLERVEADAAVLRWLPGDQTVRVSAAPR